VNELQGGITAPRGYLASGIHCGIKKRKKDLALLVSTAPAATALSLTTNRVLAAPLIVDREQVERSPWMRAIVVNSGNANACTGARGLDDAWGMVRTAAAALGIRPDEVLVSSTGVIGQFLPMDRIHRGIHTAVSALNATSHVDAADAIRTTDTFAKEVAVSFPLEGVDIRIGGMAKGSGMIAPNMATMLAFVTTDLHITPAVLQHALRGAVARSFNRITVDGDTSTNDMVVVLANGQAGNRELSTPTCPAYKTFYEALEHVLVRLSKMIVLDGEGATKFVEILMTGAASEEEAVKAARAVANSNLVKTAIHGEDANWGRILAAIGYSGIEFEPADVEIFFGAVPILRRNYAIDFSEEDAKHVLKQKEITIRVDLHRGGSAAAFWTCDLSKSYVDINANYRT
jgi:glutamate N-acetyltransferase/amino-acid N-acetyltransferase